MSERYDPNWVRDDYAAYGEQEWHRWEASPVERVKFHVHRRILETYVSSGDRVLEIGAGAGRFTRELARITDRIVVGDLSPVQLDLNRQNAIKHGYADAVETWVECDICDLSPHLAESAFDTVVCYGGSLSYVFGQSARALRQMMRVVRPQGRILLSVMSLWGSVHQYLEDVLSVDIEANRRILETGDLVPETAGSGRHYCHMFRLDELRALLLNAGLTIDLLSASDCLSVGSAALLATLDEDDPAWGHLMEMELEACRDPGCTGMGSHIIAVARKAR
jgi:SAM-dependent methyltransferase